MKSKKVLAQLAALSLLFGFAGAGTAWTDTANEVQISGGEIKAGVDLVTQDSEAKTAYTMEDKIVAGLYMDGKATLTATNVNFVDGNEEAREVAVDGGSTLHIMGGTVGVKGLNAFAADGGSTITTDGTEITAGVFANNSTVTLKDSTISSRALYAGNEWGQDNVAEGLDVGILTIDGGSASAKNVLVQNKGTITVKNGAVLDVTGDTSANDEDIVSATGLENGGVITVRAWGTTEKSNSVDINIKRKVSEFVADKATVKANAISVAGNIDIPEGNQDKYIEGFAKFTAKDSTVEAKNISLGNYGFADFNNTQIKADSITVQSRGGDGNGVPALSVKDSVIDADTFFLKSTNDDFCRGEIDNSQVKLNTLTVVGHHEGDDTKSYVYGSLTLNGGSVDIGEATVSEFGTVYFTGADTTIGKLLVDRSYGFGNVYLSDGTFHADTVTVNGWLVFRNGVKATLGEVTIDYKNAPILINTNTQDAGAPDVKISKLVMNGGSVQMSSGKLTVDRIITSNHCGGFAIIVNGNSTLSTKSGQVYQNSAADYATDPGEDNVYNMHIQFKSGTLELTDETYTLDYAKAAKVILQKAAKSYNGNTELTMTGQVVDKEGNKIEKVSIDDASLIGNLTGMTVASEKNILIGVGESTKLDNDIIGDIEIEKKVANSIGAKNLEMEDSEDPIGVVITNDKKLTLAGDEEGNLITVVDKQSVSVDNKAVKVIVGTESAVVDGAVTAGTFTVGKETGTANTLKGEVLVNTGSAFNVNGDTTITKTVTSNGGTIAVNGDLDVKEGVTLNEGAINVASGATLNTNKLTVEESAALTGGAAVTDTLTVKKDKVLSVGDTSTAGQMVVEKLSGEGMVFLDPAWKDGATEGDGSSITISDVSENITNALVAGHNSTITLGTSDSFDVDVASTGETWGDEGILSAVYVAQNVTLGSGSITADGTKKEAGTAATAGTVSFGKNSMLLVNGAAVTEKAAISGVTKSEIDDTSKLYIDGAERGQTYKILEGAADTSEVKGWEDKNIVTDNALLKFEGEEGPKAEVEEENANARTTEKPYYNVTATVKTMKEAYGDKVIAPNVYDKALEGDNDVADFALNAAKYAVNATTDAQVSALNSAVELSELAGAARGAYTTAGLVNDAVDDHMSIVHEYTHDKDVWAKYIHNKDDVDGLSIAGKDVSYKNKYNGIVVGADLYHNEKATVGLALTYGDGDITGSTLSAYTKNDAKYYGATIYGGIHNGDTAFLGDISYLHSKNDITQTNSGETITGTEKSKAFSIGVRAERSLKAGEGQFVPYAGLRYMHLSNGSYTDSLGLSHDGGDMNLWLLPVGVKYSLDAKHGSWTLRPIAEIGYVWNMGDRDARETVSFDGTSNSFGYDVTDNGSFLGHLCFEAEKGNTTFGIGYQYQKGDDVKSNRWSASVNYRF